MGDVQFVGQAPFALPMTQQTKALVVGDMVEARIRLLTDPRTQEDVIVMLTVNQALLLASQLARAAEGAISAKRQ